MKTFNGKKFLIYLVLAAALILSAPGCSRVKDIKVTSCSVKYVVPSGTRSVKGVLKIGVDNPAAGFNISDLSGTVKYYGREIGHFSADDIAIAPRSSQSYELPCALILDEKVSMLELMAIVAKASLEGVTADADVKVKRGKVGKTLHFRDLDINEMSKK